MMILRSAAPSPFGRKVQIALSLLGFNDVKLEPTDTMDPRDSVREQNPLGKIPVLIAEDGGCYYDSRVILEYLDDKSGGGKIIPRQSKERFAALRLQALCDGLIDASILTVYEGRWRSPEHHETKWLDHQAGKVKRALAALEAAPPALPPVPALPNVGQIALACALGYRDLRFGGDWRAEHQRLVAWLDSFAAGVPAFAATAVKA
ncbi:MAG: glutathione S-transferase family protein [Xanthobacteraceae bacterium]